MAPLSCDFEADGANEGIEIIDDTLIEAIELRSFADHCVSTMRGAGTGRALAV